MIALHERFPYVRVSAVPRAHRHQLHFAERVECHLNSGGLTERVRAQGALGRETPLPRRLGQLHRPAAVQIEQRDATAPVRDPPWPGCA